MANNSFSCEVSLVPTPDVEPNFDAIAPHYHWLEWAFAGSQIQRCRSAFLRAVPAPQHALLLGEGNGSFLTELLRLHPGSRVTYLDASKAMQECARKRLGIHGLKTGFIQFVQADILHWPVPPGEFDLIVSHFFLDCFRPEQLERIVPRIAASATPDARWLLADFRQPGAGWKKWRARLIVRSLYLFFHCATRLPVNQLTPPDSWLTRQGFALRERRLFDFGLLHSDLWDKHSSQSIGAYPHTAPEREPSSARSA